MTTPNLLETIKAANLQDLEAELEKLEAARDEAIQKFNGEIASLRLVIKIVDAAQNGQQKKERKPRAKKAEPAGDTPPLRRSSPGGGQTIGDRAVLYLEAAGEATATAIAKGLALANPTSIYSSLNNDARFESTGRGTWKLAGK